MTQKVFTLRSDKKLFATQEIMNWTRIRHVPVADQNNRLVGVVSHRDLLHAPLSAIANPVPEVERKQFLATIPIPIEKVIRTEIETIGPDAPVQEAARLMSKEEEKEMDQDMRKLGYSAEEEYFYKKNKELIENLRKQRDKERAAQEIQSGKLLHWMKCPKCGSDLEEVEHLGIKVDRCKNCSGIFFDKGELDILLQAQEPKGFLSGFRRIFKKEG